VFLLRSVIILATKTDNKLTEVLFTSHIIFRDIGHGNAIRYDSRV